MEGPNGHYSVEMPLLIEVVRRILSAAGSVTRAPQECHRVCWGSIVRFRFFPRYQPKGFVWIEMEVVS